MGNRVITNIAMNTGIGTTYNYSGSIATLVNTGGVNAIELVGANIPASNAVEILNYVQRSTVGAGSKRVYLRTDALDPNVISAVSAVQAKGFTVMIFPLY